jgi:hypothetical protein
MPYAMLILALLLAATVASADDDDRDGRYQSFLSCAAFHTIEASKSSGNAVDAQRAVALDYAEAAAIFAPDGKAETANADLQVMLEDFQKKLADGDPRAMAEQWTGLESACAELHQVKDGWVREQQEAKK